MTAHKLAYKLLELPDETIFVDIGEKEGLKNIKDVQLCAVCESEIFITVEDY